VRGRRSLQSNSPAFCQTPAHDETNPGEGAAGIVSGTR